MPFSGKKNVVATMLSLMLACGCAHSRKAGSGLTVPRSPLRGNAEVSQKRDRDGARRAEGKINDVGKRLERAAERSQRPAETGDRPVTQMGTGMGQSANTTGIVPASLQSGASSSVVVTQPNGPIARRGDTSSGTATSSTSSLLNSTGGTIVGFVLLAGCLIAAIVWLPRRLNAR